MNTPMFNPHITVPEMVNLLARVNDLREKLKNQDLNLSSCNNITEVFDMLVDAEEVEVLKELFTEEEFDKYWDKRVIFISSAAVYSPNIDENEIPQIRKLISIRKRFMNL